MKPLFARFASAARYIDGKQYDTRNRKMGSWRAVSAGVFLLFRLHRYQV